MQTKKALFIFSIITADLLIAHSTIISADNINSKIQSSVAGAILNIAMNFVVLRQNENAIATIESPIKRRCAKALLYLPAASMNGTAGSFLLDQEWPVVCIVVSALCSNLLIVKWIAHMKGPRASSLDRIPSENNC